MDKAFDERTFGETLRKVLSPSRAIQSPDLLKGRDLQLAEIKKAWYQPGRQVFIYGYRGVGKTSLAHTAAFLHQSSDSQPIVLACSETATFEELVRDMCAQGSKPDPRNIKTTRSGAIGGSRFPGEIRETIERETFRYRNR